MRILVWGFGAYYNKKEQAFINDMILAFVSSGETGKNKGIDIINPESIFRYDFEKLYIMAERAVFEILDELKNLGYKEWDKVVIGWGVKPYINDESVVLKNGKVICDSRGVCNYISENKTTEIHTIEQWDEIKYAEIRLDKKNPISDIPLEPISRVFGFDRGNPIDRYYIERFLSENACYIKGTILEISERTYTLKYGSEIEKSYIMHVSESIERDSIIADLETGVGVIEGLADCFIMTQTLPFIFDVKAAAGNTVRFLKDGGIALITVSGITQISRYDMDRWGHYWNFTTASLKRLFENCEDVECVKVNSYGNIKTAVSGLYGLAVEDMIEEELDDRDEDYQQIITAVVKKKTK